MGHTHGDLNYNYMQQRDKKVIEDANCSPLIRPRNYAAFMRQKNLKADVGDPDLNLSTLIFSVERDIELLEQLEMNTGEHRDDFQC